MLILLIQFVVLVFTWQLGPGLGVAVRMLSVGSLSASLAVLPCFQCCVSDLVSAQGAGQDKLGIYVKSVVKGGAADVVSITLKM